MSGADVGGNRRSTVVDGGTLIHFAQHGCKTSLLLVHGLLLLWLAIVQGLCTASNLMSELHV